MTKIFSPGEQCGNKVRHKTRKAANGHKASILAKDPDATINVYRCPYCNHFHVGNSYVAAQKEAAA